MPVTSHIKADDKLVKTESRRARASEDYLEVFFRRLQDVVKGNSKDIAESLQIVRVCLDNLKVSLNRTKTSLLKNTTTESEVIWE